MHANTVNNLDSAPEYNIPRPPRLASSSNSPHQSDTPSIMQFLTILLLAAPAVYACGDNSYRCKSPDATVDQMWQVTHRICDNLAEEDCYCSHWAEYYCDPYGDNIQKFKSQCEEEGEGWYWAEC